MNESLGRDERRERELPREFPLLLPEPFRERGDPPLAAAVGEAEADVHQPVGGDLIGWERQADGALLALQPVQQACRAQLLKDRTDDALGQTRAVGNVSLRCRLSRRKVLGNDLHHADDGGRLNEVWMVPGSVGMFNVPRLLKEMPGALKMARVGKLPIAQVIPPGFPGSHKMEGMDRVRNVIRKSASLKPARAEVSH